jgi:hypothetical protein
MQKTKRKDIIYDLETYRNIFTCCVVFADSSKQIPRVYEISDRKDQTAELMEFLRNVVRNEYRMVGFNCLNFDYPIIHYMIEKSRKAVAKNKPVKFTAGELFGVAQEIIESMKGDRFGKTIKESDIVIPQLDLYKMWHFDNKAKATSLKTLEFNMRSDNIEDLPYPVGATLTSEQMDVLIEYNKHDVMQTLKFYGYSDEAISLRADLTKQYGFDCTNYSDSKIGSELFIRSIEKESPGSCYTYTERGRKINQTKRDGIAIKDCLFPYIRLERAEFNAIHQWFKKQVIKETKGAFSDIEEHNLGDVARYAEMIVKRKKFKSKPTDAEVLEFNKEHPLGWIEEEELKATEYAFDSEGNHIMVPVFDEFGNVDPKKKPKKKRIPKISYWGCWRVSETLNVVIDGLRYDYGVGGLHSARQGIIEAPKGSILRTLDVASYYPNMAISNSIYPKHLGIKFCEIYKDLYEQRKSHPKGSAVNAALKLSLNSVFGHSNNEFSPLYDPAYTMSITIGGQLSLCMLVERLINECDAKIVMCNTDGFEFIVQEELNPKADSIVKEWEELTGLQMEGDVYAKMFVINVNNYISVTTNGKVKLKGIFEYASFDKLGWHKNHSAMVIARAVEAYFVKGEDYEEFIKLHEDKFDFMLRTKVPRSSRLVLNVEDVDQPLQNNCRYYPVKKGGGKLVKIMPPLEEGLPERRLGIDTDWNVRSCNDMKDFSWEDLNYEYFISEARKIVDAVETNKDPSHLSSIPQEEPSTV